MTHPYWTFLLLLFIGSRNVFYSDNHVTIILIKGMRPEKTTKQKQKSKKQTTRGSPRDSRPFTLRFSMPLANAFDASASLGDVPTLKRHLECVEAH